MTGTLAALAPPATSTSTLQLTLTTLQDGSVRVRITEHNAIYRRFAVPDVLMPSAADTVPFSYRLLQGSSHYMLAFGPGISVVVHLDPWLIEVYRDGVAVAVVNHRGYFNYELARPRPVPSSPPVAQETPVDANSGGDVVAKDPVQEQLEQGSWEESFNSYADSKPFGWHLSF
jgi:hypothetical protein